MCVNVSKSRQACGHLVYYRTQTITLLLAALIGTDEKVPLNIPFDKMTEASDLVIKISKKFHLKYKCFHEGSFKDL